MRSATGLSLRADRIAILPREVSPDAIAEATEISDVQRDLRYLAWREATGPYLEDLEEAVRRATSWYRFREETLVALVRRLRAQRAYGAFTEEGGALIVDGGLGLPEHVTRALAGSIVWHLFEARKLGEVLPFALIADEANASYPSKQARSPGPR